MPRVAATRVAAASGNQNLTGPANTANDRRPSAFAASATSTAWLTVPIGTECLISHKALSTETSTSKVPASAEVPSKPRPPN